MVFLSAMTQVEKVSLIILKTLIFIQGKFPALSAAVQQKNSSFYSGRRGWKRTIDSPAAVTLGAGRKAWP
jgi:hypothetical protein